MGFPINFTRLVQRLPFASNAAPAPKAQPAAAPVAAPDSFEPPAPKAKVELSPDQVSAEISAETSAQLGGVGVSASVEISANIDEEVTREDGFVTMTVSAEASVTASGKLDIKAVSVGGSASAGGNVTYEVRMSEADFERMKRGEIPPPNPMDPSTLPDGASVRLDQSQFVGTSLEVGFEYHGVELGISSSSTHTQGTSLLVERHGDKVQVTAGPTDVLEASHGLEIGRGPVKLKAGRTDTLGEFQMRTAEFDLSTTEGQEAFDGFATTGRIPETAGPGVSNPLRIEHRTYDSATSFDLQLGSANVGLGGRSNSGDLLVVHHPDGTSESTATLRYDDGPVLELTKKYDAEGREIAGEGEYRLTFDTKDDDMREYLYYAFTGQEPSEEFRTSDEPFTVTFSEDEMMGLGERSQAHCERYHGGFGLIEDLAACQTPDDVALTVARFIQGQNGLAEVLLGLEADQGQALPGQLAP